MQWVISRAHRWLPMTCSKNIFTTCCAGESTFHLRHLKAGSSTTHSPWMILTRLSKQHVKALQKFQLFSTFEMQVRRNRQRHAARHSEGIAKKEEVGMSAVVAALTFLAPA